MGRDGKALTVAGLDPWAESQRLDLVRTYCMAATACPPPTPPSVAMSTRDLFRLLINVVRSASSPLQPKAGTSLYAAPHTPPPPPPPHPSPHPPPCSSTLSGQSHLLLRSHQPDHIMGLPASHPSQHGRVPPRPLLPAHQHSPVSRISRTPHWPHHISQR